MFAPNPKSLINRVTKTKEQSLPKKNNTTNEEGLSSPALCNTTATPTPLPTEQLVSSHFFFYNKKKRINSYSFNIYI